MLMDKVDKSTVRASHAPNKKSRDKKFYITIFVLVGIIILILALFIILWMKGCFDKKHNDNDNVPVPVSADITNGYIGVQPNYVQSSSLDNLLAATNPKLHLDELRLEPLQDWGVNLIPLGTSDHYIHNTSYNVSWCYYLANVVDSQLWQAGNPDNYLPANMSVTSESLNAYICHDDNTKDYVSLPNELVIGSLKSSEVNGYIQWNGVASSRYNHVFINQTNLSFFQDKS